MMRKAFFGLLAGVATIGWIACGDDSGGGSNSGPGNKVEITGSVNLRSGSGQDVYLEPGSDVSVTAWCDRDGNGRIDDSERVSAATDDQGRFSLQVPAKTGTTLVLRFRTDGYAPVIQTFKLSAPGNIETRATLVEMSELTCMTGTCVGDGGGVTIQGGDVASGYVKLFNPVADTAQFPGPFADDQGNVLVSGAFAAFDLRDKDDNPITKLPEGQTATIRLKLPRDTWPVVQDIHPGDGSITFPMYSFDEDQGIWVREGEGELQDASGSSIDEAALPSIKDGTYESDIFAVAQVAHFSFWNVDWPVDETACVKGVLVDTQGNPVSGATVTLNGVNFTGLSQPIVTGPDGEFCFNVPRSEAEGEDMDGDGVTGETKTVLLLVHSHDKWYRFGPIDLPSTQGSCSTGNCLDLGNLSLDSEHEVQLTTCHVTGRVLWPNGTPTLGGISVEAEDDGMSSDDFEQACEQTNCQNSVDAEADGSFTLSVPMLSALHLHAWAESASTDGMAAYHYEADRVFLSCPTDPVVLTLDMTSCSVVLPTISYDASSGAISWDPPIEAGAVAVQDIMTSEIKWAIVPLDGQHGIQSPVVYGTVPEGAQQVFPMGDQPPQPIHTGDTIAVSPLTGTMEYEGHACQAVGVGYAP